MDEKTRASLKAQLSALNKAENAVRIARRPFDKAIDEIDTAREEILGAHEAEIAGECIGCTELLLVGEQGHRCRDGELLCEACAFTWADVKAQWDMGEDSDAESAEARARFFSLFKAHIAGGGSPDDKILHAL